MKKTTKSAVETTVETREPFIRVYSQGLPVLVFRESGLIYESLGPARQPTQMANFNAVVSLLRERCPEAVYDNRLLQRQEQVRLLGAVLNPDAHIDVALALLKRILLSR